MKTAKLALVAIASLLSIATQAQTVDEIIAKNIEARGGKAKLEALKTVRMETNMSIMGQEIPLVITQAHNEGQRVDITAMGMSGYIINTPKEGWMFMPFQGQAKAEPMPEEAVKLAAEQLDLQGALLNYKEKGHAAELVGKEDVDGTECFKVKLTSKGGNVTYYCIDPKTYYTIRQISKANVMGQEQEVTVNYSNFKKTDDGYVFPWSIGNSAQGDMSITKLDVNKPLDAKVFKPSDN